MEVFIYSSLTISALISTPCLFNTENIFWYVPIFFVAIIFLKLLSARYCNVLGFLEKALVRAPFNISNYV